MKFLIAFVFMAVVAITIAQESTTTSPIIPDGPVISIDDIMKHPKGKLFFGSFGNPCTSVIADIFNVRDAKCTFSCFIAGSQNGGYCDADNVCQCVQIE